MSANTSAAPVGPAPWVKFVVSVLVVSQFYVIFTVITSASSLNFPASPVARDLAVITRPYAQAFFMHNAYRFYAPEPGPTNLLWARFLYQDGSARWMELPRLQDYSSRIPYQRHIALLLMLGMTANQVVVSADGKEGSEALADPDATIKSKYNTIGKICLRSFVRYVARLPEYARADGKGAPLVSVEMYHVLHNYLLPDFAKLGWRYEDPRLYAAILVGEYSPRGDLMPGKSEYHQQIQIDDLFAFRIVERDLIGYLDAQQVDVTNDNALSEALERFGLPLPFRWPILKEKRLLQPQPREELRNLLEQVLLEDEIPGARTKLFNPPRGSATPQSPHAAIPTQRNRPASTGPRGIPNTTLP